MSTVTNNKQLTVLYSIALVLLFIVTLIQQRYLEKPTIEVSAEKTSIKLDPDIVRITSASQKRFLSKLLWVKTLIGSDTEKVNKSKSSWMFFNFKSIHFLDPYFLSNYIFGGLYLSVVKDDLFGASYLYDKGTEIYPDHFHLNYYGGIHYLFEIGDKEKALKYLNRIKNHPKVPPYFESLLARLHAESNDLRVSYNLLSNALKNKNLTTILRDKFKKSLYSIKAEFDLTCLNDPKPKRKCSPTDYKGNQYIKINGKFKAQEEWTPFRINKPKYYKKKQQKI